MVMVAVELLVVGLIIVVVAVLARSGCLGGWIDLPRRRRTRTLRPLTRAILASERRTGTRP